MVKAGPTVFVVDDDAPVRDALKLLLRSVGHQVETYGVGAGFYRRLRPTTVPAAWCSTCACRA